MLFRPEEVHPRSPEGPVLRWAANLSVCVANHFGRLDREDLLVSHLDREGPAAVETWRIDANGLSGKVPANRQRFKTSLREPALVTVH